MIKYIKSKVGENAVEFVVYDRWNELGSEKASQINALLEISFPPEERRSVEEIADNVNGPHLELLTAEENGNVYGMLTVWDLESFTFLEHFAVSPAYRGKGIGTKILDFVEEYWGKPTVLEVEYPTGRMEKRRIGFYERNGFVLNDYPYLMPDLSGGNEPVPLLLMSRPKALEKPEKIAGLIYDIPYAGKVRPI